MRDEEKVLGFELNQLLVVRKVGWVESNETQQNQSLVGFHAVLPNLHSVYL